MNKWALLAAVLLLGGCSKPPPPELAKVVIKHHLSDIPSKFMLCVAINGEDADQATLRALQGTDRTVVPASECEYVMDTTKGSYHRASGREAMLIDMKINRSQTEVEFKASHHGRWGTRSTLRVSDEGGTWRIVEVLELLYA